MSRLGSAGYLLLCLLSSLDPLRLELRKTATVDTGQGSSAKGHVFASW